MRMIAKIETWCPGVVHNIVGVRLVGVISMLTDSGWAKVLRMGHLHWCSYSEQPRKPSDCW